MSHSKSTLVCPVTLKVLEEGFLYLNASLSQLECYLNRLADNRPADNNIAPSSQEPATALMHLEESASTYQTLWNAMSHNDKAYENDYSGFHDHFKVLLHLFSKVEESKLNGFPVNGTKEQKTSYYFIYKSMEYHHSHMVEKVIQKQKGFKEAKWKDKGSKIRQDEMYQKAMSDMLPSIQGDTSHTAGTEDSGSITSANTIRPKSMSSWLKSMKRSKSSNTFFSTKPRSRFQGSSSAQS